MRGINELDSNFMRFGGVLKNKILTGPEVVHMSLTSRCDMKCLYCPYHSALMKKERVPFDLPFLKLKELVNDFSKLEVKLLLLSGDGEPFLYPKILDALKMINEANIRMFLFTNGIFGHDKLKCIPFIEME